MKYIDIHSHLIFDVDDGSNSLEQSIIELERIKRIGLEDVVCTPHFRKGKIEKIKKTKQNYLELKRHASKMGINLYIGNEIMYSDKMIDLLNRKRLLTLNNTRYVLFEFKRNENMDINHIITILDELVENGYKPILAHPELYLNYHNIEYINRIKDAGAMLQLDATSITCKRNIKVYRFSKKLLKEKLIDIVASDSHATKTRNHESFIKAYKKISKKYGFNYANIIFKENPLEIIRGN